MEDIDTRTGIQFDHGSTVDFDVGTRPGDGGQIYRWSGLETISHATYSLFLPLAMKQWK